VPSLHGILILWEDEMSTICSILGHDEDMDERNERIFLMDTEENCFTCRHLRADERTCDAFPDGIPPIFLYLDKVHNRAYPGDHGIQYERIEERHRNPRP